MIISLTPRLQWGKESTLRIALSLHSGVVGGAPSSLAGQGIHTKRDNESRSFEGAVCSLHSKRTAFVVSIKYKEKILILIKS